MASITEITWLNIQDIVLHINEYLNPYAKPNDTFRNSIIMPHVFEDDKLGA